jgi:hydroxymethylpyrimidine pyrophosphatase-like HAD family hydrolase
MVSVLRAINRSRKTPTRTRGRWYDSSMTWDHHLAAPKPPIRMIAVDMDGTLLGEDGKVSPRNLAAMKAAEQAGIEVVVATGRRHCYAMRQLRGLGLNEDNALVSSNGAVTRTAGATLVERHLLAAPTALWLCTYLDEFRNALVITFDKVGLDGEDQRGALVVEHLEELHGSIGRWMAANEPYIAHVVPIELAIPGGGGDIDEAPIQMMLCGTIERMRRAEALLLEHPGVSAVGVNLQEHPSPNGEVALHRTEYPERDLSIVDILPAGCSKGAALVRLAARRGIRMEEMLAIGDNWNDVSMLEVAGRSLLMDNAPYGLKQQAIAKGWSLGGRHDADGVAIAIEAILKEATARESTAEESPVGALSGTL